MKGIYDYILSKTDVKIILDYYNIEYKARNLTYWCCCPFHNEQSPSFSFNSEMGIYKCWGCKVTGNVFTFIKEYELINKNNELTYYEAAMKCAKLCSINIKDNNYVIDTVETDDISDIIEEITTVDNKQENFSENAIKKFYNKSNTYMVDKGFRQDILDFLEMGFYTGDKNNPMNNRCIFPVRNQHGELIGWTGRSILNNNNIKWLHAPKGRFLKSLCLYNIDKALQYILDANSVNVVESVGNTIRMLESGRFNTVATLGSTISKYQCDMLVSYNVKIIFWYDWDKGGFEGLELVMKYIDNFDILYVAVTNYGINDNGKSKDVADVDIDTVNNTKIITIYDFIKLRKERFIKEMEEHIEKDTKIKLTDGTVVLCVNTINPKLDIRQLSAKDISFFKMIDSFFGSNELRIYDDMNV